MAQHFTGLCRVIATAPMSTIGDFDYIAESEKQRLLVEFNDTRADYPRETCIHHFFDEQVQIQPANTAAVHDEQRLTYRELHDKCSDLALYLQSLGVKPDTVVGLCLERSLEMMIGIMGTVEAGGAYLPLDPSYPDDRLAYMVENSRVDIVLTQEKLGSRMASLLPEGAKLIALDAEWPEIETRAAALKTKGVELQRDVQSGNACYVIYTSGSTGKPKGVLVEHGALVNRIHWMQKRYCLTANDVVLQKTPYSFDVSVWEFFWPMMAGASGVFRAPDGYNDGRALATLVHKTHA